MMIDPPIEDLLKVAGNEYILASIIAKRAKILEKEIPDVIEKSPEKAISIAARELVAGKLVIKNEDDSNLKAHKIDFGRSSSRANRK